MGPLRKKTLRWKGTFRVSPESRTRYRRKRSKLIDPASKQYSANGVSVLVSKYLVKNFTDKYEAIAAQVAPSSNRVQ